MNIIDRYQLWDWKREIKSYESKIRLLKLIIKIHNKKSRKAGVKQKWQ